MYHLTLHLLASDCNTLIYIAQQLKLPSMYLTLLFHGTATIHPHFLHITQINPNNNWCKSEAIVKALCVAIMLKSIIHVQTIYHYVHIQNDIEKQYSALTMVQRRGALSASSTMAGSTASNKCCTSQCSRYWRQQKKNDIETEVLLNGTSL